MRQSLIFTGDVNLLGIDDPAEPFAAVAPVLHGADVVLGNLDRKSTRLNSSH